MTIAEMLGQSGILTLLGMGVVFSFLIVLIGAMNLLRIVVHAAGWDKEPEKTTVQSTAPAVDNKAIVAAIATALHEKN